uniref:Reverse transcriptase-rnase h-integrase n=1 Tax=Moniliophthora roreri TaxID=221103 RepID=A0A0W0GE57_MONRR
MSNVSPAASSSSLAGSQPTRDQSSVPTVSGEGRYGEAITYPNGLKPNPYQLLHLFNTEQYDDQIQNAADQHNRLEPCVKTSSTDSDDEPTGTGTPVPTSTTLGASSLGSPLNPPTMQLDPLPLPVPPPNPTAPSFILTPLPLLTSNLRSSRSTRSPPLDLNLQPLPTPEIFRRLKPQFHQRVEYIPAVGGEVILVESEDVAEDEEQENRIPESVEDPPTLKLRSPTPVPTPMTQLVDCVSALCADWSAISPDIARSTCVADASRLSLDIHLATAPTNKGLAVLHTDGLIRAQTLCRMVAVMTMNGGTMMSPTTTSAENVEMLMEDYDRDAQLLFVGADPKKVRMLSVEERLAMGWQPSSDIPATPRLGAVDEMPDIDDRPDTSYDYDTELYGDRES